jgi:hypothetical protein
MNESYDVPLKNFIKGNHENQFLNGTYRCRMQMIRKDISSADFDMGFGLPVTKLVRNT